MTVGHRNMLRDDHAPPVAAQSCSMKKQKILFVKYCLYLSVELNHG